jgi:O-antigen/teichoic acid export membrane protein
VSKLSTSPPRRTLTRLRGDSLTRNSFDIVATTAVNAGFGYIYRVVAARLLPTETVGLGSTVVSAMVIVSLMIYLGPRRRPDRPAALAHHP